MKLPRLTAALACAAMALAGCQRATETSAPNAPAADRYDPAKMDLRRP